MHTNQILFAIPLYSQTEESYRVKWEKIFRKSFSLNNSDRSDEEIREFRSLQLKLDPIFYRYNDRLGYAELELNGRDILIYYHLNGDLRKRYNKNIKVFRGNKNKIYSAPSHNYGSSFENIDNRSIRKAILNSIIDIKKQCSDWRIVVDTEPYIEGIRYFNFKEYFKNKNWL